MSAVEHRYEDKLLEFVYGELQAHEAVAVEVHLGRCARCANAVAQLRSVRAVMGELPAAAPPNAGLESLLAYAEQAALRGSPSASGLLGRWRRLLAPLASVVALALVGIVSWQLRDQRQTSPVEAALGIKKEEAWAQARSFDSVEERNSPGRPPAAHGGGTEVASAPKALGSNTEFESAEAEAKTGGPPSVLERGQSRSGVIKSDRGNEGGRGGERDEAGKAATVRSMNKVSGFAEMKREDAAAMTRKKNGQLGLKDSLASAEGSPDEDALADSRGNPAQRSDGTAFRQDMLGNAMTGGSLRPGGVSAGDGLSAAPVGGGAAAGPAEVASAAARSPSAPAPSLGLGLGSPASRSYGAGFEPAQARAEDKKRTEIAETLVGRLTLECRSLSASGRPQAAARRCLAALGAGAIGEQRMQALSVLCEVSEALGDGDAAARHCDALAQEFPASREATEWAQRRARLPAKAAPKRSTSAAPAASASEAVEAR
jgi:hypothetical protein